MTELYARAQVQALRLGRALRRYWRRILVGAFCGWLVSSLLGALAIVWLGSRGVVVSQEHVGLYASAAVWGGTLLGAVVAYGARKGEHASGT